MWTADLISGRAGGRCSLQHRTKLADEKQVKFVQSWRDMNSAIQAKDNTDSNIVNALLHEQLPYLSPKKRRIACLRYVDLVSSCVS